MSGVGVGLQAGAGALGGRRRARSSVLWPAALQCATPAALTLTANLAGGGRRCSPLAASSHTESVGAEVTQVGGSSSVARATVIRGQWRSPPLRSARPVAPAALTPAQAGSGGHAGTGAEPHPPFLIGVCGGTASGKTSVCRRIIELLQSDMELEHQGVVNISQDCFYKDLTPEQAANISHYNFDHPDAFDFTEIHSSLEALKRGAPVDIPQYDFVTSARLPQSTHVPFADVILFDGIMAFHQASGRCHAPSPAPMQE
eukprot:jgi/Tetstr1/433591/TSEL_022857.t1